MRKISDSAVQSRNALLLAAVQSRHIHPRIVLAGGMVYRPDDTIRLLTTENDAIVAVAAIREQWKAAILARDDLEKRARAIVAVLRFNLRCAYPDADARAAFVAAFDNRTGEGK